MSGGRKTWQLVDYTAGGGPGNDLKYHKIISMREVKSGNSEQRNLIIKQWGKFKRKYFNNF